MKIDALKTLGFIAALIMLQQLIAFGNNNFPHLQEQSSIIESNDIDPSALFYMESRLALSGEKTVRKLINE